MAKRGRKPKEKKGYFYDKEEEALVNYIQSRDNKERNKIYNEVLHPALTKMIESIIRRYKLYVPEEEFEQTFNDTISYLLTKVSNFKPEKGTKAYSYCGTVCKNYLIYRNQQYQKEQQRNTPYDTVSDVFENDTRYSIDIPSENNLASVLINETSEEIRKMIDNPSEYSLNENEIRVGFALTELLDHWEEILNGEGYGNGDGSNKFQKSSVLYFLREETMMSTKEVRDNMKAYKKIYYALKKLNLE